MYTIVNKRKGDFTMMKEYVIILQDSVISVIANNYVESSENDLIVFYLNGISICILHKRIIKEIEEYEY